MPKGSGWDVPDAAAQGLKIGASPQNTRLSALVTLARCVTFWSTWLLMEQQLAGEKNDASQQKINRVVLINF